MPNLALLALAPVVGPALGALQERERGQDPWDYEFERIEFRAFDAASWDPVSERLLEAVGGFVSEYRALIGSAEEGTLRVPDPEEYERRIRRTSQEILSIAGPALLALLDPPLSEDPRVRWNELMRRALPRYLAERGVLVLIDRVVFDEGEGRVGTLETFALRRVDRVAPVEVGIWGERVRTTRLDVTTDMEVDGAPVRTRPVPVSGQMVHGNIVFHLDRFEADLAAILDEYRGHSRDPDLPQVAGSEWERVLDGLSSGAIDLDPLVFSEGKLIAEVVGEIRSFEEFEERVRAWLTEQILHHEAFHVRDLDAGRLGPKERPPSSARSMRKWLNRWDVAHELGAYLTGARCAAERDLPLELLALLAAARNPAKPAVTRMARYAMLGAILDEITEHPSRYPSLRLQDRPKVGARKQVAGQLYRLTASEVRRAVDAAYAWYVERGGELDVPLETPVDRLYASPRARGGRLGPPEWTLAGVLAATLVYLLWRRGRKARAPTPGPPRSDRPA